GSVCRPSSAGAPTRRSGRSSPAWPRVPSGPCTPCPSQPGLSSVLGSEGVCSANPSFWVLDQVVVGIAHPHGAHLHDDGVSEVDLAGPLCAASEALLISDESDEVSAAQIP